jgi:hypothetical protein
MKKGKLMLAILAIAAGGLFAFAGLRSGSVKGTITPSNGALRIWVISSTDTFNVNVTNGSFALGNVKAGIYKIMVEATPPYKNATREEVAVKDGEITDVGVIRLE